VFSGAVAYQKENCTPTRAEPNAAERWVLRVDAAVLDERARTDRPGLARFDRLSVRAIRWL
jgi:hypothetical protein